MQMRNFLLAAALLTLCGCATGYHSASNPLLGIFGGFHEQDGLGKLTKVNFSGNGLITIEKVSEYTLRRSAELAVKQNKSHFVIYKSIFDAHFEQPSKSPNYFIVGGKPTAYAYVMFSDTPVDGGFAAREIIEKYKNEAQGAAK